MANTIRPSRRRFQSAPPHGERRLGKTIQALGVGFNPRPRMGSDLATSARLSAETSFQSAPPHGERPAASTYQPRSPLFQSAPPHGERPAATCVALTATCFNPRPRMGSDAAWNIPTTYRIVSIRAPAWGATIRRCSLRRCITSFNPRPRMGSDTTDFDRDTYSYWFQSAPPHGERLPSRHIRPKVSMFQSAPPHGERRLARKRVRGN